MDTTTNKEYFEVAHKSVPQRSLIWSKLASFIEEKYLTNPKGTVVDVGAGYCDFINSIQAQNKWAVDLNPEIKHRVHAGTRTIAGPAWKLEEIPSQSVDLVFASNLIEHLTAVEAKLLFIQVKRILKETGDFVILQPNFYYSYREYYHDYTHIVAYTHIGLPDFLEASGFSIQKVFPKFLPNSMQKKYGGPNLNLFPTSLIGFVLGLYLRSPWKPFAKQMLIVSKVSEVAGEL